MEAHIKGHANEIPDDEQEAVAESTTGNDTNVVKLEIGPNLIDSSNAVQSPNSTMPLPSPSPNSTVSTSTISVLPTPRESSSDAHSDGDEMAYYNLFTRFDQQTSPEYNVQSTGGVNPALLAAVSIAASANESENLTTLRSHRPAPSTSTSSMLRAANDQDTLMESSFIYEPLSVMRQQGYFTPAPKVEEFK